MDCVRRLQLHEKAFRDDVHAGLVQILQLLDGLDAVASRGAFAQEPGDVRRRTRVGELGLQVVHAASRQRARSWHVVLRDALCEQLEDLVRDDDLAALNHSLHDRLEVFDALLLEHVPRDEHALQFRRATVDGDGSGQLLIVQANPVFPPHTAGQSAAGLAVASLEPRKQLEQHLRTHERVLPELEVAQRQHCCALCVFEPQNTPSAEVLCLACDPCSYCRSCSLLLLLGVAATCSRRVVSWLSSICSAVSCSTSQARVGVGVRHRSRFRGERNERNDTFQQLLHDYPGGRGRWVEVLVSQAECLHQLPQVFGRRRGPCIGF
mmetsp:Transcript_24631/g.43752  ORF Transcript_24631/g.43752 Transcript_24631/m.43752 type:complete len:322 (+) Transcript_24631:1204-2169(+)